ncbi:uncharacterized protein KGF55_000913 [Candida pseudojiufengensis]|uniref:uncharacterized protein n=1 Tax=Candida pseudojiufengensis TaxID=497109 RepID=UPI002223F879|nr:uncharacterized protein KGF55_000913 [Candida pseudojiufengensis]KAI5965551.1 hypothetical protein KGF55_000913 [Candida pseudojiufengensis]
MLSSFKSAFGSTQPRKAPRGKRIIGEYEDLIPHVKNDLRIIKSQLDQYQNNKLLNKLNSLLEENHNRQVNDLEKKHQDNPGYYKIQLFELLKKQLEELCNLLDIFKNNYTHSLYDNNLLNFKKNQIQQASNSNSSPISSNQSLSSLSMIQVNDEVITEAPDYLLDPISFEVLTDPVVTPSGITYEKQNLLLHMKKRGKFDPISKQPLSKDQLYPNLVIKDSVEAYKVEHGK